MINYGRQTISKDDISLVTKSLQEDLITQGHYVQKFETKLSNYFQSKYSCAVSNGTTALHLAIKSLKLKKNASVITTPITFISTASTILMNGYKPVLADIDKKTYTLDPNIVESKIKKNKSIRVIIGVDYAGHPCDWEAFKFLKKKYDLFLINDNCHALGAKYLGSKGYAASYADIVTQSYHPVKNFTTGEGGSILTNNKKIYEYVKKARSHNIVKNNSTLKKGLWFYNVDEVGYNYRITDLQCALGISQLSKLDKFCSKRNKLAMYYNKLFVNNEIFEIPKYSKKKIYHSFHLYPLLINFRKVSKINFFQKMLKKKVCLQVHYIPLYKQPFLKKYIQKDKFPISEDFYSRVVSLPIYFDLTKNDQNSVFKKILKSLNC